MELGFGFEDVEVGSSERPFHKAHGNKVENAPKDERSAVSEQLMISEGAVNSADTLDHAQIVGFDYSTMSPDVAKDARDVADRVRKRSKDFVFETGRDLLAIKERLQHGQFVAWVQAEFNMAQRTAQNYMSAALEFGDKSEIVAHLPPTTLYKLAARSTPASVREGVVKRLEAGERLHHREVDGLVTAAKEQDERAREEDEKARQLAKMTEEERKAAERKAQRQCKTEERREAEVRQRQKEYQEGQAEKRKASEELAAFIVRVCGNDLPRFATLWKKTGWFEVNTALKAILNEARDYPEFRVWAGMMGGKEFPHATTQRAAYT